MATLAKPSKTQERPEKKAGMYFKPSTGKNVARVTILGISACAAIRGLGKLGFSIMQCAKLAEEAGATLNLRTVSSHVRLGRTGSTDYGAIPDLSRNQIAEAKRCVGDVGSTETVETKAVNKAKKKSLKMSGKLRVVEVEHVETPSEAPAVAEVSSEVKKVREAVA